MLPFFDGMSSCCCQVSNNAVFLIRLFLFCSLLLSSYLLLLPSRRKTMAVPTRHSKRFSSDLVVLSRPSLHVMNRYPVRYY